MNKMVKNKNLKRIRELMTRPTDVGVGAGSGLIIGRTLR